MPPSMKKELLELLEKDKEFRYAVIGYLGLDRIERTQMAILEEVKKLWEEVKALRENQEKLWEEVRALREGQERLWEENRKLWEEVKALREGQERLWEEVKALREGQGKLWEENRRIWEEIKALREEQEKLWEEVRALREGQERLWEEVKALRENQEKLWEEVKALREGQGKLWEEVRALREGQGRLWDEVRRVWRYVKMGFEGIREALGVSFEEYVASFVRFMLYELGYPEAKVEARKHVVYEGRLVELNVFSEEPLIVGEATLTIKSVEEAEKEVKKLGERVNIASKLYSKKPLLTILAVGNAPEEVIDHLKELTSKQGIKLIIGRELKETF